MRILKYIYECFFSRPSEYQLRKNVKNPNLYMVFFKGKRIHEGTYKSCQEFLLGQRIEVSPSLYQD